MENLRAGMFVYSLAFLCGVVLAQQQALLFEGPVWSSLLCSLFAALAALLFIRQKCLAHSGYITLIILLILLINIGYLYTSFHAKQQLSERLPERYAGVDLLVEGVIDGLPVARDKQQRFELAVSSIRLPSSSAERVEIPLQRLRLSWYYGKRVSSGERWQLLVRLKPPHGFMNPGGFDYEAWLFQQRIGATGYVRKGDKNHRLAAAPAINAAVLRQAINAQIDRLHLPISATPAERQIFALIKALATGDKSDISNQQWEVLAATGTSHLMAISGLHVGLAALFAFTVSRRLIPVSLMKHWPAQNYAMLVGLGAALLYALIAGLSIPTQRAIIMLMVLVLMQVFAHHHRPLDSLGFAIVAVLLFDPQAVLSAGFWFSFAAVAIIFMSYKQVAAQSASTSLATRVMTWGRYWVRLQLMISLFLLPLSLYMFQQASLVSPLVNLLLIPYVSFLVVPLVLLGIVSAFLSSAFSALCFVVAAQMLDLVWPLLEAIAEWPLSTLQCGQFDLLSVLSVMLAFLLLVNVRRITQWSVASRSTMVSYAITLCILLLSMTLLWPLLWPLLRVERDDIGHGEMRVTVLDVGQGSAAVIETRHHVVVFDTGARLSDKLDIGSSVIIPYLRWRNREQLDLLIVSHGDNDHIGGAPTLLAAFPGTVLQGQDIQALTSSRKRACEAGQRWIWDGVSFAFLSPAATLPDGAASTAKPVRRNNHSCVLKVQSDAGSVLFTGDIEKNIEADLVSTQAAQLTSDVLIVPHHGSKTSSSVDFVEAVDPELAIISAGYRNRYRLPSTKVVRRYLAQSTEVLVTEQTGAVIMQFQSSGGIQIDRYREQALRYWHHKAAETLWTRR